MSAFTPKKEMHTKSITRDPSNNCRLTNPSFFHKCKWFLKHLLFSTFTATFCTEFSSVLRKASLTEPNSPAKQNRLINNRQSPSLRFFSQFSPLAIVNLQSFNYKVKRMHPLQSRLLFLTAHCSQTCLCLDQHCEEWKMFWIHTLHPSHYMFC